MKQSIKDLDSYEGGSHNGHTLKKHVVDKKYVEDRALNDRKAIKGATSFRTKSEADAIVRDVIERNAKEVADWMNSAETRPKAFESNYDKSIGFGSKKSDGFVNNLKEVKVVLKKSQNGFEVLTSYPIYKK